MIRTKFSVPSTDAKWSDWLKRTRSARQQMWAANGSSNDVKIDEALYKEQRERFFEAFHGKCAYCELRLAAGQRFGDVEHFRPKGRVTDIDGKLVFSTQQKHSGYFWLAYNWRNLLPSCLACNRPGTGPEGLTSGKWDRFPTLDKFWSDTAWGVRREKPLLLNPWLDDPEEHLIFDDTGVVGFRTRRGEVTIDVLGLNRDALIDDRREACELAAGYVRSLQEAYARQDITEANRYEAKLDAILLGNAPYSAAALSAAQRAHERHEALLQRNPLLKPKTVAG
jgi:uncharacterized protein (TIGR02646 family)